VWPFVFTKKLVFWKRHVPPVAIVAYSRINTNLPYRPQEQTGSLNADFLKFVGPSGQKITRTGNTAKYASPGVQTKFFVCVFCFAPEIRNGTGMPERSWSTRN
jgi:hypothetical protein